MTSFLKRSVPTILLLCFSVSAMAQMLNLVAKDGTEFQVDIIDNNPDNVKHLGFTAGIYGIEGMHFVGANYYAGSGRLYANVLAGPGNAQLDGSIFLASWLREKTVNHSLKVSGNTSYVADLPVDRRYSLGVHLGGCAVDYTRQPEKLNDHTAAGAFIGMSFLRATHLRYALSGERQQRAGTNIRRINADAVYYAFRSLPGSYEGPLTLDEQVRKVGFRVYLDGKWAYWTNSGMITWNYVLGIALNSKKESGGSVIAGLGVGLNFM